MKLLPLEAEQRALLLLIAATVLAVDEAHQEDELDDSEAELRGPLAHSLLSPHCDAILCHTMVGRAVTQRVRVARQQQRWRGAERLRAPSGSEGVFVKELRSLWQGARLWSSSVSLSRSVSECLLSLSSAAPLAQRLASALPILFTSLLCRRLVVR